MSRDESAAQRFGGYHTCFTPAEQKVPVARDYPVKNIANGQRQQFEYTEDEPQTGQVFHNFKDGLTTNKIARIRDEKQRINANLRYAMIGHELFGNITLHRCEPEDALRISFDNKNHSAIA